MRFPSLLATLFPKHPDGKISLACAIALSYQIVAGAFNYLLSPIVGFGFIWDSVCVYALAIFFMLLAAWSALRRQSIDSVLVIAFVSLFIGITFVNVDTRSTQYQYLNRYIPYFFGFCIPAYLLFRSIRQPETLTAKFRAVGLAVCLSAVVIVTLMKVIALDRGEYNMVFGYHLLTGVVVLTDDLIEHFRLTSVLIVAASLLIILFYGSRGPILCYAVFLVLRVFFTNRMPVIKKFFCAALLTAAALLLIQFSVNIAEAMIGVAHQIGFEARTLQFFVDERMAEGRFFDKLYEAKAQVNLLGLGVAGDTNIFGLYSHNLFFEMFLSFGWLYGGGALAYIFFFMGYGIFLTKNSHYRRICQSLFCCSFVKLLVTGTVITETLFYACLAVSTASFFFDLRSRRAAFKAASRRISKKIASPKAGRAISYRNTYV